MMQPVSMLPPSLSMLEQLPGCWGCKDKNSVFVYANSEYCRLVGLKHPQECIGKTDHDMPCPTIACADQFQAQDKQVMETGKRLRVLDIHPYANGRWYAHLFTKTPWYDEAGNICGVVFCGQELSDTAILEVGHWICRAVTHPEDHPLDAPSHRPDIHLTARESEVLFLHLYGKKPQLIAQTLGVSVKTIENHFAHLREKFGVESKAALIERALALGFGSAIPERLLSKQVSVVLRD
ncbi:helix-turn-helix transcriptional regulator [Salinivibrio sp. YCSC6]|nr:helix-turn-helix transcriptional regulator [Salinivibrio sp. YCSC6]